MKIIKTNNSNFRKQLINLYVEAFSTGISEQYIDLEELNRHIDLILREGYVLLAIKNEDVVGSVWLCPLKFDKLLPPEISEKFDVEKCLYLAEMMVTEKARGQGVGKQLMTKFFDTADKLQFSSAFIRVWDQNTPALKLYRNAGFKDIASIKQTKNKAGGVETFDMQKIYLHTKLI
jgi:ribosomal protein S18 acetylase RimI-like enzyme